jgi:hypothetical protein
MTLRQIRANSRHMEAVKGKMRLIIVVGFFLPVGLRWVLITLNILVLTASQTPFDLYDRAVFALLM